jgi:2-dehydro-3-deoxygluconokinase
MTVDVVTLGETMALLVPPRVGPLRHARTLDLGVAGAESNLAVGVARLGGRAAWIGRVGDDEFGRLVRMTLAGEGVHAVAVVDGEAPTGLMVKERRTAHTTRVQYYRKGSAGSRLRADDLDENLIRAAKVLHVTGITLALSPSARDAVHAAIEIARAAGVLVSFDVNHRTALWSDATASTEVREVVKRADVVLATEEEARLVVDAPDAAGLAGRLAQYGAAHVLIKRGADGAVALVDGVQHTVPAVPVAAVDPVGAGDAFGAAYLTVLCRDGSADERLRAAAAAGAFAVTVPGDWEGLPSAAELDLLGLAPGSVVR